MRWRLEWAKKHAAWNVTKWHGVIFSDESAISLGESHHYHVHRRREEPIWAVHTVSRRQYRVKVMFWGWITVNGPAAIVPLHGTLNAVGYINLLQSHLHLIQRQPGRRASIFQQDNAPCHKALAVRRFFEDKCVAVMNCAAYSPGMNIIAIL